MVDSFLVEQRRRGRCVVFDSRGRRAALRRRSFTRVSGTHLEARITIT
jgi:hypothetical protein